MEQRQNMQIARETPLQTWLVILCLFIVFGILQYNYGMAIFTDDPFISFRYARNIANGHGAVFNTGQRVEGYTNFLWVIVLAGIIRLGGDPVIASKWLGAGCNFITLGLVVCYSRRFFRCSRFWFIAPLCLACNRDFIRWGGGGLETPLFVLCATASMIWLFYRHPVMFSIAGTATACAALTRPEGIVLGPLMAITAWWTRGKGTNEPGIPAMDPASGAKRIFNGWLILVLPYQIWRITYFGNLFPNTFYCKVNPGRTSCVYGFMYVADFFRNNGHLALLIGVIIAIFYRGCRLFPLIFAVITVGGIVILEGGDWMPYHRFMLPVLPILFLLSAAGYESMRHRLKGHRIAMTRVMLITATVIITQPLLPHSDNVTRGFVSVRYFLLGLEQPSGLIQDTVTRNTTTDERWIMQQRTAGEWFRDHARPGASLALGSAGIIPYYSEMRTIDFFGKVTPSIARGHDESGWAMAGHQKYNPSVILSAQPDYIVFSGSADPGREPQWWLKRFQMSDHPEFRNQYTYRVIDNGDFKFGFYERTIETTASNPGISMP